MLRKKDKEKPAKESTLKDAVKAINKLYKEVHRMDQKLEILRKRVEQGPTNENIHLW